MRSSSSCSRFRPACGRTGRHGVGLIQVGVALEWLLFLALASSGASFDIRATTESSVSIRWHRGILVLGFVFIVGTTASLFLAFILIGLVVWFVHATIR